MTKQKHQASVIIESLSHDGRGLGHIQGKTVFIDQALPEENIKFHYIKRNARYDQGCAYQIENPSPHRVLPPCQHFGVCGGCNLQHMDTQEQIAFKQRVLSEQLTHMARVQPKAWLPPLLSASDLGYRHKARLGVKYVQAKKQVLIGFREKYAPRYITHMTDCPVLHPKAMTAIQALHPILETLEGRESFPQLEIAMADQGCALVLRHLQPLSEFDQIRLRDYAEKEKVFLYTQSKGIDSIIRLWPHPDQDPKWLSYTLQNYDLCLHFKPNEFTQINPSINQQMLEQALVLLNLQSHDYVLDLFSGIGNFSLPLAKHCQYVLGIEGETDLVQRAQENAQNNALTNVEFLKQDLYQPVFNQAHWPKLQFDKLLLDPPRSGAMAVITGIKSIQAKRILYVSCNPATLARDAGELVHNQGYTLDSVGVMDMFPHTAHTEAMALFVKK